MSPLYSHVYLDTTHSKASLGDTIGSARSIDRFFIKSRFSFFLATDVVNVSTDDVIIKKPTIATKKTSLIKSEALRYLSATLLLNESVNKSGYNYLFAFTNDQYTCLKRHFGPVNVTAYQWNDGLVVLIDEDQQFVKEKGLSTPKAVYCGN